MVCVPCIVIPFILWVFHKYIRPIVMKFWPWSTPEKIEDTKKTEESDLPEKHKVDSNHSNGAVANGQAVTVGGGDKKTN